MSRGISALQRCILEVLDSKNGMSSTRTLKKALPEGISNQSFYRSLQSLEKRDEIWFHRGGVTGGLVCKKHGSVLLIDADSTIPNLALMKLSAYHKARGDAVDFHKGLKVPTKIEYDIVYISCIFSRNARAAKRLVKRFPNAEVHLGGSGVDLTKALPAEIEHLMPDYDLYPECDFSMGYTSRGCLRHCDFCVVPKKEGKAHAVADIYEFWDRRHKKIVLLDNNILAVPEHFKKIANQIIKEGLAPNFQSGFDIRLLTEENAAIIKDLKVGYPKFAWDNIKDEPAIKRGIALLKDAGVKKSTFYVLCGFNSTFEEDLYRLNSLRELGQAAYVMLYERDQIKDRKYFIMRDWTNSRPVYFSQTFEEFLQNEADGSYARTRSENRKQRKIEKNPPPQLQGCEISSIEL